MPTHQTPPFTLAQVAAPPAVLRPFAGPSDTIGTMVRMIRGERGEKSLVVLQATRQLLLHVQPKDYLGELLAIRHFCAERVRYVNDPLAVESVQDPERMLELIARDGSCTADCDDVACLIAAMCRVVGRQTELVTVGFGAPNNFSHVFVRAREPKSGQWIVLDPVAGTDEARMLSRVTTWKAWRID